MKGRNRCDRHGGKTPRGAESPHFVHGNRMRHMPASLQKLAEAARTDPELMKIRQDVWTIEALINDVTGRLKDGKAVPAKTEARLLGLVEQRRKHLDSEARRLKDLQQMVSAERFIQAQTRAALLTSEVIRELCAKFDEPPEPWLLQVQQRYARLRLPAAIEDERQV